MWLVRVRVACKTAHVLHAHLCLSPLPHAKNACSSLSLAIATCHKRMLIFVSRHCHMPQTHATSCTHRLLTACTHMTGARLGSRGSHRRKPSRPLVPARRCPPPRLAKQHQVANGFQRADKGDSANVAKSSVCPLRSCYCMAH